MFKKTGLALGVVLASTLIVTQSHAEDSRPNAVSSLEQMLPTFRGSFQVEYVHHRLTTNGHYDGPFGIADRSAADMQRLRQSIAANHQLTATLKRSGVKVRDIGNVFRAADGSMIIYVQ